MRQTARMLAGLAILLVTAWAVRGEPTPDTIQVPEVMVRSGPSPEFYSTSKLRKGDRVRVLREEFTGWLAILPPPGSFSWIDSRQVQLIGTNAAVVSAAEAQIWVGSRLVNTEPTVWRTKAAKGTQLTVIGKAERGRDGIWLPIQPVPAEVRYIPAEAVRPSVTPQQVAAAAPAPMKPISAPAPAVAQPAAAAPPAGTPAATPAGSSPPPTPPGSTNPLWLQADEAERAGNTLRAQELLQELATQVKETDYPLFVRCHNRIADLRERSRTTTPAQAPPASPATANTNRAPAADRLIPSAAGSSSLSQPRASSEYCYLQDTGRTARLSPPINSAPSPPPPTGEWSDVGRLCRTAFALDGKPLFCLQPIDPSKRHVYVAAGPEVNLEPYVERTITLYGPVVYRGDLRTNLVTALQIRLAR